MEKGIHRNITVDCMASSRKKKILFITRNFPPMTGGMERLMYEAAGILAREYDLTIIGPPGCTRHAPANTVALEAGASVLSFNFSALLLFFKKLRGRQFDLIIGGSGVAAPSTSVLKLLTGSPSCIFIHGLDLVVSHTIYQTLFIPLIKFSSLLIANSRFTSRLAEEKGVAKTRLTTINPGTDTPPPYDGDALKARLGLSGKPLLLYVGRIIERKGLLPFLEHSFPSVIERYPEIQLLIVGEEPMAALKRESGLRESISRLIAANSWDRNITFLGRATDTELWQAYQAADALIFPLVPIGGDAEGFGMVAIEAASQGTPTIAFACGGVADAIDADNTGHLIEPGNYPAFSAAVLATLGKKDAYSERCIAHAQNFGWPVYEKKLLAALQGIIRD
jgi:phosphatidylinositol alpha-1,6-mannosyltransferase